MKGARQTDVVGLEHSNKWAMGTFSIAEWGSSVHRSFSQDGDRHSREPVGVLERPAYATGLIRWRPIVFWFDGT
jgi:hypothetical protein